jgi:CTP synthase
MQLACIEYAKNVINMSDATSSEINPKSKNHIIHDIPMEEKYQTIKGKGTSMRLGGFDCIVKKDTLAYSCYTKHNEGTKLKDNNLKISERHRHRYEFNNKYREQFEKAGFVFSGTSPDGKLIEAIELKNHKFFVGTQYHPEYISRALSPHPIFVEFLKASANK